MKIFFMKIKFMKEQIYEDVNINNFKTIALAAIKSLKIKARREPTTNSSPGQTGGRRGSPLRHL